MRGAILCLLLCFIPSMTLEAQSVPPDAPTSHEGSGPGGWMGLQAHDKYYGLSLGYPFVQRGGRSLGLHLGFGSFSGSDANNPFPDGLQDKSGMNLGLYVGGNLFCAAGVERMKRTDAHAVSELYRTYSYNTTEVRTSGYFLLGYRSWPGLGIYVQAGGPLGFGVGISLQL